MIRSTAMARRDFLQRLGLGMAATSLTAGQRPTWGAWPSDGPNRVFLVVLDTVRADHLDCYGYPRSTMPFVSALAKDSVQFMRTYCACSHTNPAHLTLFSGLYPAQHKLVKNSMEGFDPGVYTMAQFFQEAGYRTAAFCSVPWLRVFERGFEHFHTIDADGLTDNPEASPYAPAKETVDKTLEWLGQREADEKCFVWVHLYDAHTPYLPPAEFEQAVQIGPEDERVLHLKYLTHDLKLDVQTWPWSGDSDAYLQDHLKYEAELRFMDSEIRRLYENTGQADQHENSLWVLTADHGQGLGAHGYRGHGMHIYEDQLRVPLLVHAPGAGYRPRRVQGPVQHLDLLPTVADILNSPVTKQVATMHGQSLLPLLNGEGEGLPVRGVYAERRRPEPNGHTAEWEKGPIWTLIDGDLKYIVHANGADECYDLASDPHELTDLHGSAAAQVGALREKAQAFRAELVNDAAQVKDAWIGDQYKEHLEALGYL